MSSQSDPTTDESQRFHRLRSAVSTTRQLAGAWADAKTARLQAAVETPDSWVAGGGDADSDRWQKRRAKRKQLEEYHKIRVDGGIISTLLESRALMVFGPGGKFVSEDDEVAEWLNDQLNDRDNLTFDLGCDAYFYGYSLGELIETRGGDFSHIELIEPWTTVPERDRDGTIKRWEQKISEHGTDFTQDFDPEDIVHFKVLKSSGRDRVGMSMLGRGMDEAKAYRDNQKAIQNAVQMQGFPKYHVKLGREGGAVIDDNELRRARPMFDNIHELTKWVTGQDVDIDVIEAENFEFEGITEHDLSKLAIAFMLPVELTQIGGGDGLGTGFPAKLRRQLFLLGARSQQRLLGDQLVQQIGRPLLEEYSPFDSETQIEYVFDDPITDMDELQTKVDSVGEDMTVNERRELFDMAPLDDDSIGEDFDSPGTTDSGGDGLFMGEDTHDLADREDFWWEDHFDAMADKVAWGDDTDHRLFGFSEGDTPEFVKERLREAVLSGSPIFSDIESLPDSQLGNFRMFMMNELQEDGWTISGMQDAITDEFGVEPDRAETMARSTTQNMVSEAAENGYRERDDFESLRFKWPEISDGRESAVCENIVDEVPEEGLPLGELKDVVHQEAEAEDLDPRGWTPHPNCRRRPIRVVN